MPKKKKEKGQLTTILSRWPTLAIKNPKKRGRAMHMQKSAATRKKDHQQKDEKVFGDDDTAHVVSLFLLSTFLLFSLYADRDNSQKKKKKQSKQRKRKTRRQEANFVFCKQIFQTAAISCFFSTLILFFLLFLFFIYSFLLFSLVFCIFCNVVNTKDKVAQICSQGIGKRRGEPQDKSRGQTYSSKKWVMKLGFVRKNIKIKYFKRKINKI